MNPSYDFSGRRVLVTGGGRGIGRAIVEKFYNSGAQVIAFDHDQNLLTQLEKDLPNVKTVKVDLRDWDSTKLAVESVLPIHHLINNAGVTGVCTFMEIDHEKLQSIYDVNFNAVVNVSQVVSKRMIQDKIRDGTIVSLSSTADDRTSEGFSMYGSTKAALTSMTKSMALELAPYNIRVTCLRPGPVDTGIPLQLPEEEAKAFLKRCTDKTMFKRFMRPEEIANIAIFLSSTGATPITGTGVAIDCGGESHMF